jgi:hypothetical protein
VEGRSWEAELEDVSGRLLIEAFRFSGEWIEYGANDAGVIFGIPYDDQFGARIIQFIPGIPDEPDPLPRALLDELAHVSGLSHEGIAQYVRAYRAHLASFDR